MLLDFLRHLLDIHETVTRVMRLINIRSVFAGNKRFLWPSCSLYTFTVARKPIVGSPINTRSTETKGYEISKVIEAVYFAA